MPAQFNTHTIILHCCQLLQKKQTNKKVVFLPTMHATRSQDSDTQKEEINMFFNHEKGGVGYNSIQP